MRTVHILNRAGAALALVALAACVSYPTEKQSVVDARPQISFRVASGAADARVLVDGLDMGRAGDFAEGTAALRVLPGTHQLTVQDGQQVYVSEKFYVADGVSRTFSMGAAQ
ncbi:MAG: hypothetical protein JWP72_4256 [Massilia sp.]|jgi:hypothetical protein|nr:hypothetical protein [Massilia sp.]MDB5791456.1 hypothetical protein [Massilia sp.]